jgi:chemotaxis protein MotB
MRPMIALEGEEDRQDAAGTQRWMVSYADFVTLLFVLFMVLYAKAPRLPAAPPPAPVEHILSAPEPQPLVPAPVAAPAQEAEPKPEPVPVSEPVPTVDTPAPAEPGPQQRLLDELTRSFTDLTAAGHVILVARKDGVVLEISDTSLFASGTAQPAPQAHELIDKIAAAVGPGKNAVIVEGHTDNVPIKTSQYPSNWELSSARAASVVRALQERGISPERLAAAGLAQTRPRSSNETAQGRSENRRVSLIVLNE